MCLCFRFYDYYFTSVFGWKCLVDVLAQGGNHLASIIGFVGDEKEELLWFEIMGNNKQDVSLWPPMRWQHICIVYNKEQESVKIAKESEITMNFSLDSTKSINCLLYTSPSPRDGLLSRMPSSA